MTVFDLYTREQCPQCDQVKQKLKEANIDYKEIVIGKDIDRDTVIAKFPDVKVTPVIVHCESDSVLDWNIFQLMLVAEIMRRKQNE